MSLSNGGLSGDELVAELRTAVSDLHAELPRNGLVAWTSGNVSARVPGDVRVDLHEQVVLDQAAGHDHLGDRNPG